MTLNPSPVFALLLFENHPTGTKMLQECIKNQLLPTIIIQERSKMGDKRRLLYENLIGSNTTIK